MPKTVADVLALASQVKMVDLRFTDLPGVWQHFTIPAHVLAEDTFENGIPFDGSSIRGFKEIHESDMLLMLDPATAFIDPIFEIPTLVLIGDVFDPITREPYSTRPALHRQSRRNLFETDGDRRQSLHGARAGVLHLQRCALW